MRTYYHDDDIDITSDAIMISGQEYRLCDLDRIWRRGSSPAVRGVLAGLGVIVVAAGYRIGASAAWWFGDLRRWLGHWATAGVLPLAFLGVGMLLVALLGVLAFEVILLGVEHVRRYGRYRELWARVWGEDVLLLRTSDSMRFGMICRALRRALADQRSGPLEAG
jgi:hypothetical protein